MNCDVTWEELAALTAGDLPDARRDEVAGHLADCDRCRARLAALERSDGLLAELPRLTPRTGAVRAARQAASEAARAKVEREIMTLDEVAAFLRISPDELGEIAEELPAFELAGRIRVRREKLIEWIAHREAAYARQVAASRVARASAGAIEEGAMR